MFNLPVPKRQNHKPVLSFTKGSFIGSYWMFAEFDIADLSYYPLLLCGKLCLNGIHIQ